MILPHIFFGKENVFMLKSQRGLVALPASFAKNTVSSSLTQFFFS